MCAVVFLGGPTAYCSLISFRQRPEDLDLVFDIECLATVDNKWLCTGAGRSGLKDAH
jgi:hypothetical protein